MATHSSILAWKIPWTEEPGGLQSTGRKESDTTERLHFHCHSPEGRQPREGGSFIPKAPFPVPVPLPVGGRQGPLWGGGAAERGGGGHAVPGPISRQFPSSPSAGPWSAVGFRDYDQAHNGKDSPAQLRSLRLLLRAAWPRGPQGRNRLVSPAPALPSLPTCGPARGWGEPKTHAGVPTSKNSSKAQLEKQASWWKLCSELVPRPWLSARGQGGGTHGAPGSPEVGRPSPQLSLVTGAVGRMTAVTKSSSIMDAAPSY